MNLSALPGKSVAGEAGAGTVAGGVSRTMTTGGISSGVGRSGTVVVVVSGTVVVVDGTEVVVVVVTSVVVVVSGCS